MGTDRTGLRTAARTTTPRSTTRVPTRTCVGCRGTDSWSALLRVVAETDDAGVTRLAPDPRRLLPGRGAWLHPTGDCFDLAVRRRAFGRALRVSGHLDPSAVAEQIAIHEQTTDHPQGTESGFDADEHPMRTQ